MKKSVVVLILVVMLLIIGAFFILNRTETASYDLTKKYGINGNAVDYGIYEERGNYDELISKMERIYLEKIKEGKKVYFVFGNEKEVIVSDYEGVMKGKVGMAISDIRSVMDIRDTQYTKKTIIPEKNKVEIIIDGKKYNFDLKPNENIFFVITED
ncbi:MAG: hypothetical protein KKA64_04425 [Nanoarchaeota archaeon]|nr:hypothetical protein [Nanoarchaeota archaeon]